MLKEHDCRFMRPNKDHIYLGKLRAYFAERHILPKYETIADLVGMRSKAGAFMMASRLKEKGFLKTSSGRRIQPGPRFFESVPAERQQAATNTQPAG